MILMQSGLHIMDAEIANANVSRNFSRNLQKLTSPTFQLIMENSSAAPRPKKIGKNR